MLTRHPPRLPSLDGLRAFEVAARRLNFTEAGLELCVTQGAVSQRIKALELELGAALFVRGKAGLALTPDGQRLARGVGEALERIRQALEGFGHHGARPLKVSVLPSFALCWMLPRLHRLATHSPATRVELLAEREVVDLRQGGIDLAVRFGAGNTVGYRSERLMEDSVVPVCAPALAPPHGAAFTVADLVRLPILHDSPADLDASGSDWASWLRRVGAGGVVLPPGQHFGQADLVIEAAARGLGVALARLSLVGDHLASGRLVRLPLPALPTAYAYHLVWRPETDLATATLRAWLHDEARADLANAA